MKKFFKYILVSLLPAYLIVSLVFYASAHDEQRCSRIEITLLDSTDTHFTSVQEIRKQIKDEGIDPTGKPLGSINTEKMEKILKKNQLIARAECYKSPSGIIRIDIEQRVPIMRIISGFESYHIDENGDIMPTTSSFTAYLPLATGYITHSYAKSQLYPMAVYLKNNPFWDAQIEQIYVTENNEIELIPRIGDNLILLGKIDNFEQKLENLQCLYEQALSKVGWNKYDTINLKYNNQVICSKRDK